MSDPTGEFTPSCPIPIRDYPNVLLAHGGGGRLMNALIHGMFLTAFGDARAIPHDGAVLDTGGECRIAYTTDSFVVKPLFFPGGDIGKLAVCGTVNDLAMCGARPKWLSAAFILEEGLPVETLWRVVCSMRDAADAAGVRIVTGDTKVVERGKADGLYITTSGVGLLDAGTRIHPDRLRAGDAVLLSGDLGRHGIAVMAQRESIPFETTVTSDCASLHEPVAAMLEAGVDIHCLRDCTRGGLGAALVEIAGGMKLCIDICESSIAVPEEVSGACELLGLDPLFVANEGCLVAFVPEVQAEEALSIMRRHGVSRDAARIGTVKEKPAGLVTLQSRIGSTRIVDLFAGEQLPRIC